MKRSIDLSLYLVTNRAALSSEEFFRIIRQAIAGGVKIIQLREKEVAAAKMIEIGKTLQSILKPLSIPLIINDRIDVARAINADGLHLGQSDVKVSEARAILGSRAIIGLSVETAEQVIRAKDEEVDYLSASPVFASQTKRDCGKPLGLEGLKQLCSLSNHPIVAIGGIDETNVERVFACGVAGVAIVSAIFNAPCPETATRAIRNRVRGYANSRLG